MKVWRLAGRVCDAERSSGRSSR